MELPKRYDPKESEPKWLKYWEENKIYAFDAEDTDREIYSIDTPPPTVSGKMHMGHAFGNSQQDFIARYKRMKGFNVLQPFGTDDNGLPTQLLIQKMKKVRATDMDRKEFRKLCLETLENELRPSYLGDWKRLGISCDFDVKYTTINEHCQKLSQWSFIEIHKMGRAYRKEAPAMWCPKCGTAISQVETEDRELQSHFNDIIFKIDGKDIVIATTRPELLPACVAVFFHPDDKRYKHLKGKKAKVPLFDIEVPVMEEEGVDPEKGTGIMMCCTFGDQMDMDWQKKYDLPIKTAIDRNGRMTELAGKFKGKKIKEARAEMVDEMKRQKLLVKQKEITHAVNCHERCGTEIEFVHSKQWFIKYLDLKDDMLKWGKQLKWFPTHYVNRYENWIKGLSWDWCISRQIPFGIPFPVWYCDDCGEVILAKDLPVDPVVDKPPVDKCPKCGSKKISGEKDNINTWATSSLTPTIVKELFKGKPVYKKLKDVPFSLRPQGHDIITFWLFNTVVKSQMHFKILPWEDCFINGWMLDPKGKKMSKSRGNVIEPQVMIDKYSADMLRYMASGSKLGDDLNFPEKEMIAGKRFMNKLWNASKFCIMNLEGYKHEKPKLTMIDQWLLSRLHQVIQSCTVSLDKYEFHQAKAIAEKFFWQEFCDMYLEIVKYRLYNDNENKASAQYTLFTSLYTILKLFSPLMPFITEEIYHMFFMHYESKNSIHITEWPVFDKTMVNEKADKAGELVTFVVAAARKKKSDEQVSLKEPIKHLKISGDISEQEFNFVKEDIKAATVAEDISYTQAKENSCDVEF